MALRGGDVYKVRILEYTRRPGRIKTVWYDMKKCVSYAGRYTEQIKMTGYIKQPHTGIITGPTSCGKSHLVLDLIGKGYKKCFDYIIIICPMLQWNKAYCNKGWIRHDGNIWIIYPKYKLYQWVEQLSVLLERLETLFIIDYIIADETLDKQKQSLLELAISGRHCKHYI